jgi:hypothetical protein
MRSVDSAGLLGCFAWIVQIVFWGLLYYGRDELGPKWIGALALLWLAGWWVSTLLPGGAYLFMSLVAAIDIILVLVVLQGDLRIT